MESLLKMKHKVFLLTAPEERFGILCKGGGTLPATEAREGDENSDLNTQGCLLGKCPRKMKFQGAY